MSTREDAMVALLEDLMDAVRRGEVVAIAIASVHDDANAGMAFFAEGHHARLHYALATLTHRVLMHEDPE